MRRSIEESQAMVARHQSEMNKMKTLCSALQHQVQQKQQEQDQLTQQMRQLVEAQWNTVNRIHSSSELSLRGAHIYTTTPNSKLS